MEPIEEVILRHRSKLLGFIQKRVSDPDLAEDVLQEGLFKAFRSADELRDEERLLPWFYRILNNAIIDAYRKQSTETRNLEAYALEERARDLERKAHPEDEAALCECFRELLPSLKLEYAELIDQLELQSGDPAQVAQRFKIQPNNLKVRLHRARVALKQRLEEICRMCAVHGCLDCTCRSAGLS